MKKLCISFFLFTYAFCFGQTIVYDRRHFQINEENHSMRFGNEKLYQSSLEEIKKKTREINENLLIIYKIEEAVQKSLTTVDEILKNSLQVKNIGETIKIIIDNSKKTLLYVKEVPELIPFAETSITNAKRRGLNLVKEIYDFILKSDEKNLMNYAQRELFLQKIQQELYIINGLICDIAQTIYYVKLNGFWKSLNPFQDYVNTDLRILNEIIAKYKIYKTKP